MSALPPEAREARMAVVTQLQQDRLTAGLPAVSALPLGTPPPELRLPGSAGGPALGRPSDLLPLGSQEWVRAKAAELEIDRRLGAAGLPVAPSATATLAGAVGAVAGMPVPAVGGATFGAPSAASRLPRRADRGSYDGQLDLDGAMPGSSDIAAMLAGMTPEQRALVSDANRAWILGGAPAIFAIWEATNFVPFPDRQLRYEWLIALRERAREHGGIADARMRRLSAEITRTASELFHHPGS